MAKEKSMYKKLERVQQTVALALEFHDQGGFKKSADLFLEAADLYREINLEKEARQSLIAAAKVQLKCSQRQLFLLTMARYKGILGHYEMPSEEERFLVNLSDYMKGKSLTYPVKAPWQVIFKH